MIRKDRPDVESSGAAALIRGMSAEGRGELLRRMEDCDGLPAVDPTARMLAPAGDGDGDADAAAPPWWEWARRLSRLYGWTPAQIGRMTAAQVWIYLTDCRGSGARRRMPLAERAGLLRRAATPPRSVDSPENGGRAMTILFKELAGSPTETYAPDGFQAERRLLCAYEDRYAVVAALLAAARRSADSPRRSIQASRGFSPRGCGSSRSRNRPTTRAPSPTSPRT